VRILYICVITYITLRCYTYFTHTHTHTRNRSKVTDSKFIVNMRYAFQDSKFVHIIMDLVPVGSVCV
jgi:hypothetical protein